MLSLISAIHCNKITRTTRRWHVNCSITPATEVGTFCIRKGLAEKRLGVVRAEVGMVADLGAEAELSGTSSASRGATVLPYPPSRANPEPPTPARVFLCAGCASRRGHRAARIVSRQAMSG